MDESEAMFVFDIAARSRKKAAPEEKADLADILPDKSVKARIRGEKMTNVRVQKVRNFLLASAIVGTALVPTRTFATISRHDKDRLETKPAALVITAPVKTSDVKIKPIVGSNNLEFTVSDSVPRLSKSDDILKILGLTQFPAEVKEIKLGENAETRLLLFKEGIISINFVNAEKGESEMQVVFAAVKAVNPINFGAPQLEKDSVFVFLNTGPQAIIFDERTRRTINIDLSPDLPGLDLSVVQIMVDISKVDDRKVYLAKNTDGKLTAIAQISIDKDGELKLASK